MISPRSFWLVQLTVVVGAVGIAVAEWQHLSQRHTLPVARQTPLSIDAAHNYPSIISDDQLREVLQVLKPRLRGEKPRINHLDHALRFWGVGATFQDERCLSGQEMRDVLTNHQSFTSVWGDEAQPLLQTTESGVGVRTREGEATASHVDHTLAGLAEVGTPIDFRLVTDAGPRTVHDMLIDSLRSFELNQPEYEWSTLAYLLYFPHIERWYTSDGQEITFDRLARRMIREPLPRGVCYGNHRLYTLTAMLQVDREHDVLSPHVREEIYRFLHDVTRQLVQSQHADGYWDGHWSDRDPLSSDDEPGSLASRIMVTGHALEWWAIAPDQLHPPRETMVRAGQWLYRTISEMDPADVTDYYTYLTHAGRALTLWRGTTPEALAMGGWIDGLTDELPSTAQNSVNTSELK